VAVDREPFLKDVESAFRALPRKGKRIDIEGDPELDDDSRSHIQGAVRYKQWWIHSFSHHGAGHGWLLVYDRNSHQFVGKHATPKYEAEVRDGAIPLDHPGGIQMCGDFLFVSLESADGGNGSKIIAYDMSRFLGTNWNQPTTIVERSALRCGAVGVTTVTYPPFGGFPVHLVVSHDNELLHFYYSNGEPLGSRFVHFEDAFHCRIPSAKTQAVGLVTDWNQQVYLIGLRANTLGTSYADHVALYRVDLAAAKAEEIVNLHLDTKHGEVGMGPGVHFRWGAGVRATSERTLEVLASQERFVDGKLTLNSFAGRV
jgi:hypothetical protein